MILQNGILHNSSIIFDVGANRGQSIVFYKRMFPSVTIFAFEPSRRVFQKLEKRHAKTTNCKLFELGLGSFKENRVFYEHVLDETSTFCPPTAKSTWQKRKNRILLVRQNNSFEEIVVQMSTLDILLAEEKIEQIDLLKIDVEGFEYDVLKGATNSLMNGTVKAIQIERHMDDMRSDNSVAIHKLLTQTGFNLCATVKHTFGNFYEDIYRK